MSERERYPAGVPCWVDTLQPDPHAALTFYAKLFGWEFAGPGAMPGDPPGRYFVAQHRGRDVAGIGSLPDRNGPPGATWSTYIRVENAAAAAQRAVDAGGEILAGALDVLPAGRLAVVADPAGAAFGLWEARSREGAQRVNEPGAWAMSRLQTSDPDRAKAFYGAVFDWRTEPFGPAAARISLWRSPGYVGGEPQQPVPRDVVAVMIAADGAPTASAHWGVDFWVDDIEGATQQAALLGGKVIVPPHDIPGFKNAVLADPQGAVFSVSELIVAQRSDR